MSPASTHATAHIGGVLVGAVSLCGKVVLTPENIGSTSMMHATIGRRAFEHTSRWTGRPICFACLYAMPLKSGHQGTL